LMEQLEPDSGEANDQTRICSFRFVDLGHDGNLTLLVSRYDGGRGGCGDVYIVDRTAGGFQQHDLSTTVYGNDNVSDVLSDIDGKSYLTLHNYQVGDECSVGYTKIYAWDGSNYSNQSDQPRFKPYYEQEIEMLKKRVADDNPECNNRSIAMIQRDLLGAPPNTGLDDAIRLTKSSDPLRRVFATYLLADIGTAETKPYLRALISDPNREVANAAKQAYAFGHFEQKPPPQEDILPQIVGDQVQTYNQPVVGPWRLILPPPFNGAAVDLKADYSKWWNRFGFDSQEQCEYGAKILSKDYGQTEPYRDGKCVPASTLEESTTRN
jgi:hypothetical protein